MTDRENRSDRLRKRFDREDEREDEETDASEQSDEAPSEPDATTDGESVKDRPSVLMYLPEETRRELDIRFDELNARHKREHGEPLEKNRDYYPAVIEAGLEGQSIEEIFDL